MNMRRIIVTGASRGIGRAVAEQLLRDGREVALVARNEAALRELAELYPARALVRPLDLVGEDLCAWVSQLASDWGLPDALVYAAGLAEHQPLAHVTEAQMQRAYSLHVNAPFQMMQALAGLWRPMKVAGSIVHVASTLASKPAPGTTAYAASKAALIAVSKAAAIELATDGIRVNVVSPGVVDTQMVRQLRLVDGESMPEGEAYERRVNEQLEGLRRLHPLGRLGTVNEVAETIIHALDAGWMTGAELTIDGGLTLG